MELYKYENFEFEESMKENNNLNTLTDFVKSEVLRLLGLKDSRDLNFDCFQKTGLILNKNGNNCDVYHYDEKLKLKLELLLGNCSVVNIDYFDDTGLIYIKRGRNSILMSSDLKFKHVPENVDLEYDEKEKKFFYVKKLKFFQRFLEGRKEIREYIS